MFKIGRVKAISVLFFTLLLANVPPLAFAEVGPEGHHDEPMDMMDSMREQHRSHEHGHDFEVIENMSPAELSRLVALMQDVGLVVPEMDAARGRELFVETGCVVCHSVNGVGGDIGPSLNADDMPSPMNAFEFAARMWRGAEAMTIMQQDMLGGVIALSGQDLADLVAFAHDRQEQQKLTENQLPERFRNMLDD